MVRQRSRLPREVGENELRRVRGEVRIAENYYLQIAQETGWLGLGLFLAILIAVGWELAKRRRRALAVMLLASLVGISVVNVLSHAWADDTLSLLWWGLAGIALVPAILKSGNESP
jgi:O-antigen ligase